MIIFTSQILTSQGQVSDFKTIYNKNQQKTILKKAFYKSFILCCHGIFYWTYISMFSVFNVFLLINYNNNNNLLYYLSYIIFHNLMFLIIIFLHFLVKYTFYYEYQCKYKNEYKYESLLIKILHAFNILFRFSGA